MSNSNRELQGLLTTPPTDLVAHFDAVVKLVDRELFLDLAESIAMSEEFRGFHPLASAFGLIFLDDDNTSNHHAYITLGPLAGAILYLSHDGDTQAVFSSLAEYLAAVRSAQGQGELTFEAHEQPPIQARDQPALTMRIAKLIEEDEEPELIVLLASWDASSQAELEQLVRHPNFYVAEAIGNTLARLARPELLPFATILAGHPHIQAAHAGQGAVAAILGKQTRNP